MNNYRAHKECANCEQLKDENAGLRAAMAGEVALAKRPPPFFGGPQIPAAPKPRWRLKPAARSLLVALPVAVVSYWWFFSNIAKFPDDKGGPHGPYVTCLFLGSIAPVAVLILGWMTQGFSPTYVWQKLKEFLFEQRP